MIEFFIIILGLFSFVDGIFDKFNMWGYIEIYLVALAKGKYRLIHDLAMCLFCQRYWVITIITVIVMLFKEFEFYYLITPFVVLGLFQLIKYRDEN